MEPREIECHCGAIKQTISVPSLQFKNVPSPSTTVCNCNFCRRSTGLLCTTYIPIASPATLDGTSSFTEGRTTVYFCSTCGCHVFRSLAADKDADPPDWQLASGPLAIGAMSRPRWRTSLTRTQDAGTADGLQSTWEATIGTSLAAPHGRRSMSPPVNDASGTGDRISATCACGRVRLSVSRPDPSGNEPRIDVPDVLVSHPDHGADTANSRPKKWWDEGDGTKFRAGTCVCHHCRLTSGFENQPWAYMSPDNIHHLGGTEGVDFDKLHNSGMLQAYETSPRHVQEFCPGCGATVIMRDLLQPWVVALSVGLLQSPMGALALDWLHWSRDPVNHGYGMRGNLGGHHVRVLTTDIRQGIVSFKRWQFLCSPKIPSEPCL
jgi:hypothetical protein